MLKGLKSPVFLLRWLNASVMRWPATILIVNLFYSVAMTILKGKGLLDNSVIVPAESLVMVLFALVWGFVFTLVTPPLSQRCDIDSAGLLGRGIYGVFCFMLFTDATNGLSRLVLLFCAVQSVVNILICRKSAHKKQEKSEGEILINLVAEGKMEVKNMLHREMRAMCETAKDYETIAKLDEALASTDERADEYLGNLEKEEGVYVLPKEKDAKGRTFTKLKWAEGEIKSPGVIVTKRGVFSLNIIYDNIKLKKQSEEMFCVERPNGQPVDVRPYVGEIFEKYKALADITQYKYPLINILTAFGNADVIEMIEFHKMPVLITGMRNLETVIQRISEKTGKLSDEEVKAIYEMIQKHVVKEGAVK